MDTYAAKANLTSRKSLLDQRKRGTTSLLAFAPKPSLAWLHIGVGQTTSLKTSPRHLQRGQRRERGLKRGAGALQELLLGGKGLKLRDPVAEKESCRYLG